MKTQITKKERNFSKNFLSKTYGFTLVELIIVITILAILATIAFISFKNYSGNARDGNRVSTLKNIEKGLELYFVKTGEFPSPDGNILTGYMSGTQIMYSGEIGDNISSTIKLNKLALDPTLGKNYKYGVTANKQEYNLGGIGESDSLSQNIIPTTYANTYYGQVVGNYKGFIKYSTGSSHETYHYLTNVPSLIFTYSGSVNDVYNDKEKVHFVIKKGENIPYKVSGKVNTENPDDVIKRKTGKSNAKFENIDISEVVSANSDTEKKAKIKDLVSSDESILESFGSDNEDIFETIINGGVPQTTPNNPSSSSSSSGGGIPILPLTCTYLGETIPNNEMMNVYSENIIPHTANYDCEDRKGEVSCNDGILSGDITFGYKAGECIKGTPSHCSANSNFDNDGKIFNVPQLNHGITAEPKPYINVVENNGIFRYELTVTCTDGSLDGIVSSPMYQSCSTNYHTEDNVTCISDTKSVACSGSNPGTTASTLGTATVNITWNGTAWPSAPSWSHSTTAPGACQYQCKAGYYSNGMTCTSASAGSYVASAGATSQIACPGGQTSPAGATSSSQCYTPPTFQQICSANNQIIYTNASGIELGRVNNAGTTISGNPGNLTTTGHIVVCSGNQTGYVLKSVNEGATAVGGFTETEGQVTHASYGNYYQFGKSNVSWIKGNSSYNWDWKSPGGINGGSANDWGVTEANKLTATYANSTEANRTKMRGPCPTGYHVPTYKEWNDVYNAWGGGSNGMNLSNTLKLPLSGFYDYLEGTMDGGGDYGNCWFSSPSTQKSYDLFFYSSTIELSNIHRSYGIPVRCFKN